MIEPAGADWDEVRRIRRESEDYARKGDMLAAAMLDAAATRMVERLMGREEKKR